MTIQRNSWRSYEEMNVRSKAGLIALLSCGAPLVLLPGVTQFPITAMSAIAAGCVYIGVLAEES